MASTGHSFSSERGSSTPTTSTCAAWHGQRGQDQACSHGRAGVGAGALRAVLQPSPHSPCCMHDPSAVAWQLRGCRCIDGAGSCRPRRTAEPQHPCHPSLGPSQPRPPAGRARRLPPASCSHLANQHLGALGDGDAKDLSQALRGLPHNVGVQAAVHNHLGADLGGKAGREEGGGGACGHMLNVGANCQCSRKHVARAGECCAVWLLSVEQLAGWLHKTGSAQGGRPRSSLPSSQLPRLVLLRLAEEVCAAARKLGLDCLVHAVHHHHALLAGTDHAAAWGGWRGAQAEWRRGRSARESSRGAGVVSGGRVLARRAAQRCMGAGAEGSSGARCNT